MLDLIYPPVCGICEKINKKYLCKSCKIQLKNYTINKIICCKNNRKSYYDYQIKILKYEGIVRNKIIEYKFKEKAYLYKTLEKIILNDEKIYSFIEKYDIIIPIPLHRKRKGERGYNQTELIAKELAKDLNLSLESKILKKIRDTKKQSTLTKKERIKNVENAFVLTNTAKLKNKKILLFDDIYTTGSTLNECSKLLRKAEVKEISILTIAID